MTSKEIRQTFLDFFASKGHQIVPSAPMVVKGDWYWDATFEQMFPKQGLYLTGTLLHVLADEVIQTPNGSEDRLRFVCTVKKTF